MTVSNDIAVVAYRSLCQTLLGFMELPGSPAEAVETRQGLAISNFS
ncbi:MAG: hypothetical protein LKE40_13325 [Spirochaetia bacterium]|nr:hypothetical protein [Spirochaetia bacterium]